MELTPDARSRFNDFNRSVFKKVISTEAPLWLNGSYKLSPWSGDQDLYSKIPMSELGTVLKILQSVKDDDTMKSLKMKAGDVPISLNDLKNPKKIRKLLMTAPEHKRWVKKNWILWTNGKVEEVSIVYDLGNPSDRETITKSIEADVEKYRKVNLYKALKRRRLLLRSSNPERQRIERVLDMTRPGLMYLSRVHAENIEKAKGLFSEKRRKEALGNLRQNVQVILGMKDVPVTLKTLPALQDTLVKRLNAFLISNVRKIVEG